MTAITLPNMSFSAPTSSCRMNKISNVKLTTMSSRNRTFYNNVKAMATGGEKLSPKMKVSQASPRVLFNQFPVARTVQQMMDTMDRIVEDPLVYNDGSRWIVVENEEQNKRKMPWLIKEGQDDYKIRFNMPGMNKNDVKVWIEEKMLVVKAEKVATEKHEGQANGNGKLSQEHEDWPASSYDRYYHRISLPENIEFEKIKAQVRDGVLYITIPKAKANAKVIGIDVQ
ncbi:small heat shock protein, chloroplastic-like [Vicia villosa]|uniref:small heat shock protein, chloroplastic-like n=1 Tax=Vicia villosa TaxID=3911 RepID=UPI00273BF00E|nr:small heat shock protein, chloroplastic-like [Vicia villosa]